MNGAVAVDFGATSARFAVGWLTDRKIEFDVVAQEPHVPVERRGRLEWDVEHLIAFCRRAVEFGNDRFEKSTLGIDSWGVDHGFIDASGKLLARPVCYRDSSHVEAFEQLAGHREKLYELTGIQHQPFNTICQLLARRLEDPSLPERARWLILPDLFAQLLTGEIHHELTQASTTQLLGLDGNWSEEAFRIVGWPVPLSGPTRPATLGPQITDSVRLAHVGSHDTASAVAGFGQLGEDQLFLNVGTWSLVGCVLDEPIATRQAEAAQLTNERTVDDRVRLLKNIPGFYVINRLHEELGVPVAVPEWLSRLEPSEECLDLLHPELFNPTSMVETCASLLGAGTPKTSAQWAGLALRSLTKTVAGQKAVLEQVTGRQFSSIRVGGGGSQSRAFCQFLANNMGIQVVAGPAEATVLGNIAVQLLASGEFASFAEMNEALAASAEVVRFDPEG